ncbi:MAG: peptide chain release factor-like protein, partial [Chloroflexi bacterium]|nr:peptide chain release factor-like protein [Chloroflexota bacterium]
MTSTGLSWRDFLGLDDAALLAQCEFDRFRASGPGGQKRNVTDSAVRLRHRPTGLAATASESRSQHENRRSALTRLRRTLALGMRAPVSLDLPEGVGEPQGAAPPPELAAVRTSGGRIAVGRRDARFLPAVAVLFDLLEVLEWRLRDVAPRAGLSTAAIGRLLAQDA